MDHDKAEFYRVTRILWDLKGIKHIHKILLLSKNSTLSEKWKQTCSDTSNLPPIPLSNSHVSTSVPSYTLQKDSNPFTSLSLSDYHATPSYYFPATLKQHLSWCFCFQPCLQQPVFYIH